VKSNVYVVLLNTVHRCTAIQDDEAKSSQNSKLTSRTKIAINWLCENNSA